MSHVIQKRGHLLFEGESRDTNGTAHMIAFCFSAADSTNKSSFLQDVQGHDNIDRLQSPVTSNQPL